MVILNNELFCLFHNLFEYNQVKAGLTLYIEEFLWSWPLFCNGKQMRLEVSLLFFSIFTLQAESRGCSSSLHYISITSRLKSEQSAHCRKTHLLHSDILIITGKDIGIAN